MSPSEATPDEIPSNSEKSEPESAGDNGSEDGDFETDAMRLLAYSADALRDDSDLPAFSIDRDQFNDSGTPQMLHIGRDDDGEIVCEVWTGRADVKDRIKPHSVSLYKRLRKLLMSYEMGEEVPVCTVGSGGNVGVALLTLDERPEIKSP